MNSVVLIMMLHVTVRFEWKGEEGDKETTKLAWNDPYISGEGKTRELGKKERRWEWWVDLLYRKVMDVTW